MRSGLRYALGACARLCYGTGLFDTAGSDWGHLDPPLDGEGFVVVDQICEAMHSEDKIQAGCPSVVSEGLKTGAVRLCAGAWQGQDRHRGL